MTPLSAYYGLIWEEAPVLSQNALMMNLFLTNTQAFALQDINRWTGAVWITCRLLCCFY